MTLFIVDKRIPSGYVCSQCDQPAVIKKFFRLEDYEWEFYSCKECRYYNEIYLGQNCRRCSLPESAPLCGLCTQELNGGNRYITETVSFMTKVSAMFAYANFRYSGGTA